MSDLHPNRARRIAITGANGMIGRALTRHFHALGDLVIPISRRPVPGGIVWNPAASLLPMDGLKGVEAVIHLAGENIGAARWTADRKRELVESRTSGTRLLATTLASLAEPPKVLVSASAMGIYGDQGDAVVDEASTPGSSFLADLVIQWEAAAEPARQQGIRVVHPRFGLILTPDDGALAAMLPTARLGLGGPMGNGDQWWAWITLADTVRVVDALIETKSLRGAVNVATPIPVRQRDFAQALGAALHRPAFLPAPAFVLRVIVGEMADEALLTSARMVPAKLLQAGFGFTQPALLPALQELLTPRGAK